MSPEIESHLDFPEREEMNQLAEEFKERVGNRSKLRPDREATTQNENKIKVAREQFIAYLTGALLDNPDHAREIVEFASEIWEDSPGWKEGDYRSVVFGELMETQISNGLYEPKEYEKPVQRDYSTALKFIERRMKIVKALIDDGFAEFEPYYDYMRDARCKLKIREMTFWMRTEHEESNLQSLETQLNKGGFWNDLLVYTTQKSPNEIGGVGRVVGENRIPNSNPSNPDDRWESIRSGNQIAQEVQAESFKYDLYVMSFIALLEKDLEVGSNNKFHYRRMGEFSRFRNTKELCRKAQKMCLPTIDRHNLEVSEKVRTVIDTNGRVLIPEPDPETFKAQLGAIIGLFPQYKVAEEVDAGMPEEIPGENRIENCDYSNEDGMDYTPFEGMDIEWADSSEED